MQKQVFVVNKEPVQKVPGLVNLVLSDGEKISTFHPDNYQLNTPLVIEYEEVESKTINKKTGKPFKQNRAIEPRAYHSKFPTKENNKKFEEMMGRIGEVDMHLTALEMKLDKLIEKVDKKEVPF